MPPRIPPSSPAIPVAAKTGSTVVKGRTFDKQRIPLKLNAAREFRAERAPAFPAAVGGQPSPPPPPPAASGAYRQAEVAFRPSPQPSAAPRAAPNTTRPPRWRAGHRALTRRRNRATSARPSPQPAGAGRGLPPSAPHRSPLEFGGAGGGWARGGDRWTTGPVAPRGAEAGCGRRKGRRSLAAAGGSSIRAFGAFPSFRAGGRCEAAGPCAYGAARPRPLPSASSSSPRRRHHGPQHHHRGPAGYHGSGVAGSRREAA